MQRLLVRALLLAGIIGGFYLTLLAAFVTIVVTGLAQPGTGPPGILALSPILPLVAIAGVGYAGRRIRTAIRLLVVSGVGLTSVVLGLGGTASVLSVGPHADPLSGLAAVLFPILAVLGVACGPLLITAAVLLYRLERDPARSR